MKSKYGNIAFGLMILVTAETFCLVWGIRRFDKELVSLIYLLSGIGIAILPMFKATPINTDKRKWAFYLLIPIIYVIAVQMSETMGELFARNPLNVQVADMLPMMKIMCQRFLAGEQVYAVVYEIWKGTQPIYLPAMWASFLPAVILDFDMRWICVLGTIIACISILMLSSSRTSRTLRSLAILLPLGLLMYGMICVDRRALVFAPEGIVYGFYALLALALFHRRPVWIGIALALCLMSRYALALWAVMYVAYVFFYDDRKKALITAGVAGALSVILMFASQAIYHLDVFLGLQGVYQRAATNPRREIKLTPTIENNLGVAKFFEWEQMGTVHNLFLIALICVPLASILLFHIFRKKIEASFFALCSLKLSLVFFFNFLAIPVHYLFYTSSFISLAILYAYLNRQSMHEVARSVESNSRLNA